MAGADLAKRNPCLVVPGTNCKLAPASVFEDDADLAKRSDYSKKRV